MDTYDGGADKLMPPPVWVIGQTNKFCMTNGYKVFASIVRFNIRLRCRTY